MVELFIVRFYDGFDNQWMDVSEPINRADADALFEKLTMHGAKNTSYADIDYYAIFPADTRMIYSGGFGER